MTYLTNGTWERLQQAFLVADSSLNLIAKEDYVSVENSCRQSDAKIREIITKAGFCALTSRDKDNENFLFTLSPYKIPPFFRSGFSTVNEEDLLRQTPLSKQVESSYRKINERIANFNLTNLPGYAYHFNENKKNILSLAKGVAGTALILGLGNGHDIPLAELALQFERITVIDIDLLGMKQTIKKLPPHLQKKIDAVQKDLTGMVFSVSSHLENLNPMRSEVECLNATADIINESMRRARLLSSSKKYDFVVSSMVTSQLFSQIHVYIMDVLQKRYPGIKEKQSLAPNFSLSLENLEHHVCEAHLENLHEWTHLSSKIYYADTTHLIETGLIEVEIEKQDGLIEKTFKQKSLRKFEALPNKKIDDEIRKKFLILQDILYWQWNVASPSISLNPYWVKPGSAMQVAAYSLNPRSRASY